MAQRAIGFSLLLLLLFCSPQVHCSSVLLPEERITWDAGNILDKNVREKRELKTLSIEPPKQIALTFDDGPDRINTPKILDILEKENVVATFFVIGEKVGRYPEMIERIFSAGHLLANHSQTHADLTTLLNEEIIDLELEPASRAVQEITGFYPKIMRPPYGSLRPDSVRFLEESGWQIVRWSLDTYDWDKSRNQPEEILARINLEHHPNAIILMHCNGSETVETLPEIINILRSSGYDFVTVAQLLDLDP